MATVTAALLTALVSSAPPVPAPGVPPRVADTTEVPVDTTGLASGPTATMEMLYERTIFRVDVMRLTLRFGPETAGELGRIAGGREYGGPVADSVARAAVGSRNVLVRSRFVRDVSFGQFMEGLRRNLGNARDAGFLSSEEYRTIMSDIESQYEPIRGRGIRDGETMWYRVRGDTLHVALQTLDGSVLIDRRPVGPERRRAVLGGYLAPESDFREELIRSLFRDGDE